MAQPHAGRQDRNPLATITDHSPRLFAAIKKRHRLLQSIYQRCVFVGTKTALECYCRLFWWDSLITCRRCLSWFAACCWQSSAMTSSHNDDKDAVLPDQVGIAWDETGTHSEYTNIQCIHPFTKKRAGVANGSLFTPSCISSFHNAKERDEWHSRCSQKPIAFTTYCMICRGIVQKPSPFSWVCDVYGSIRGMQILSLQIFPKLPPLTAATGTR